MRIPWPLFAATVALILSGCAAAPEPPPATPASVPEPATAMEPVAESVASPDVVASAPSPAAAMPVRAPPPAPPPVAPAAAKTAGPDRSPAPRSDVSAPDVFILYTGELALSVDDGKVAPTIDRIIDAAIAAGGHIGSRRDASVSVVVPSAAFRQTFGAIEQLGDVTHRSIAAEDVSEEYHDADVRLQNLRATRKRLEEFLAKAPGIAEMMTVEHELERVVLEIDRIEGRMRFLREHTAFSTLTVNLVARPARSAALHDPPSAGPRAIDLPARWLGELGVNRLLAGK